MKIQLCRNYWTRPAGWEDGLQGTCIRARQVKALGEIPEMCNGTKIIEQF